jgi:hypothetical protein
VATEKQKRASARFAESVKGIAYWEKFRYDAKLYVLVLCGKNGKVLCCWQDCDITDPDMLSIDHIFGIPKGEKRLSGAALYYKIKREGNAAGLYQTLCHNHQWKKEILRRRAAAESRRANALL